MVGFKDQSLVLVTTMSTYVEFCYIKIFSVNKYQNFEGMW